MTALPMRASASTVSTVTQGPAQVLIRYTADAGELNALSISRDAGGYLIVDPGARPLAAAGDCTVLPPAPGQVQSDTARCPAEGVFQVIVTLSDPETDGDNDEDRLTIADSSYPSLRPPQGQYQIIAEGGPGRDLLTGGLGLDMFVGGQGRDVLTGGSGEDWLQGGEGNDEIFGGAESDSLSGGDGDDKVVGGDGDDELRGGKGEDGLRGEAGDDRLDFALTGFQDDETPGRDDLNGGTGDDLVNGGPARTQEPDVIIGGDGSDTADFSQRTRPLTIDLDGDADDGESGERDNVRPDVETVIGGSNADRLTGSTAANVLDGREGEDTIEGFGGDDTLLDGVTDASGDSLSGGTGNDTMRAGPGDDALAGGAGDDRGLGGGGDDWVEGEAGTDSLAGGTGADTVDGGQGDDKVNGGAVAVVGADGPDRLIGGPGADVLLGGRGNDLLDGGLGPDYIDGESETDTVTYEDRTSKVSVTLDGKNNDGEQDERDNVVNVEKILGGILGDDLSGDARGNTIAGKRGQDLIRGDLGADRLFGGAAGDVVMARDGVRDVADCAGGQDLVIADRHDRVIDCDTRSGPGHERPIVGRSALVRPQNQFGLRLPRGPRFFPLAEKVKVPIGSTIDPRTGVMQLTTARNRAGAREVASISAGRFTLRQGKGARAVTTLRLAGKLPDCRGSSTRREDARQPARPSTRRLRVNVRNNASSANRSKSRTSKARSRRKRGKWKVRGRYSVGGSYGTEWITEDSCEGTRTTVISGTVRVRDLVRRKTVTVGAGHTYLAAPGQQDGAALTA
jgi:Ca2+-binding RTX toxin-like protein